MDEVQSAKLDDGNKRHFLKIIFAILAIIIVGLVIGIVVALKNNAEIAKQNSISENIKTKIGEINSLANSGEYEPALTLADELASTELGRRERMELYLAYKNIYDRLVNLEESSKYQNLYMEEYLIYSNGGAGLE